MTPNFKEEKKLWKRGYKRVACLDEAGRGPLSGPVIACAVCINCRRRSLQRSRLRLNQIKDSKKLSPKKREKFYKILINHPAIEWGIGRVSEKMIDKINILEATKLAMIKAVGNLKKRLIEASPRSREAKPHQIDFLILDGNFKINLPVAQKSIVKADEKVFSCACASIIAKVTRDRIMKKQAKKYPKYQFEKHKGYPTKLHRKMLRKYGPCKIHRKTFRPVKACL